MKIQKKTEKNFKISLSHFRQGTISLPHGGRENKKIEGTNSLKIRFPINIAKIGIKKNQNNIHTLNRKFTLDNLFKGSNNDNKIPININIQNININNYNIYNNVDKKLPIINDSKNFNSIETLHKQKMKKIKVIDIQKIKSHNSRPNTVDKIKEERVPTKNKIEVCEDNNDSFMDELADLLINVNNTNKKDIEEDKPINIEQVNKFRAKRPETSYGGLYDRKKSLQTALKSAKYRPLNRKNSS